MIYLLGYLLNVASYILWGLIASIFFLLIYQIRLRVKNERVSWFHSIMLLLLGLYLTILFSLTVSPVYGFSLSHFAPGFNLIPFDVLTTITKNPTNFWGNIILFIPFGVLLILLSNRCQKLSVTLFCGAGLSFLIEFLQLFSTRGADIDDIILNTLGTLCGYFIGKRILNRVPSLRKKVGVLIKMDGKYYRKRKDAQTITVLTAFILVTVFAAGFSVKTGDPQVPTDPVIKNANIAVEPLHAPITVSNEISAANAYLWNINSNTILYDKASDSQIAPASTTKMLTALTVLDYCDQDDEVRVGGEVGRIAEDASRAWLYAGNELTVRQLLDALLVPSGNDAAYALAIFAGRKICHDDAASIDEALAAFVEAMNKKAAYIGAVDSHFVDPDGYDADGQYTTAQDLALIAKALLQSDLLRDIAGSYQIADTWLSGQQITYCNTNELLNPQSPYYYPSASGLKTGSSKKAGGCLVSSAYINNDLYICVVMGSTQEGRWQDTLTLYNAVEQK